MSSTLTTKQAAMYLGIAESTLRLGRMNGVRFNRLPPPPFIKMGRKVAYLKRDLDQWIQARRVVPVNSCEVQK